MPAMYWEYRRWTVPASFGLLYLTALMALRLTEVEALFAIVSPVAGYVMWPAEHPRKRGNPLQTPLNEVMPDGFCLMIALLILVAPAVIWVCRHLG